QAGCAFPELTTSYLDNLERLGIAELDAMSWWSGEDAEASYAGLEGHPRVRELFAQIEAAPKRKPNFNRGLIRITALGGQFIAACVVDRSSALVPSTHT